jgi:ATP-dependent Clp protease ATP-binding subunit ClpC
VPAETLNGIAENTDYYKSLRDLVMGQDHAVGEVARELGLIKAGLTDPSKPASVMLFVGPTGTGKTEMAKVLARFYSSSKKLKTFTLGNYSEPHSVSGIIGVPAGYKGHERGGRIVNELLSDPYSVFLMDEADKAHPDVMQPLLNLFDEGWICDQKGVKAFADRAMFILTTNVSQRQIIEMCKQGKSIEEMTAKIKETLSKIRHSRTNRPVFTAEFLARLKRIIIFRSLTKEAMQGITCKLIKEMEREWLQRRQKTLTVSDEVVDQIAIEGFKLDEKSNGKEGGRIIRKLIADRIESAIQQAISNRPSEYKQATVVAIKMSGISLSTEKSNGNGNGNGKCKLESPVAVTFQ